MNYTIYIRNGNFFYNLTCLNSNDVEIIISKIIHGATSLLIKGEKYSCEKIEDVQVFECDSKEKYYEEANNSKEILDEGYAHTETQKISFKPNTLIKFNRNVTDKFLPKIVELNIEESNNETLLFSAKNESGLFFKGQYYDAIFGLNKIIASAKKEIKIVDNYVNEELINFFAEKDPKVSIKIITSHNVNKINKLLLSAFNKQYGNIEIRIDNSFHDRFLIIDNTEYYHFGASLKDLGSKVFMFSKINQPEIQNSINAHFNAVWNSSIQFFP